MTFQDQLNKILYKYEHLSKLLSDENFNQNIVRHSKEYSELQPVVKKITEYRGFISDISDMKEFLADSKQDLGDIDELGLELNKLSNKATSLEKEIKILLLPKDEDDDKNAILEIRSGTGGLEAGIFAADLFTMYAKYAEKRNWKFEILSISHLDIGGYKEASALIKGKDVFAKLKFESGVHRVQRIPKTETSGRLHTSAATVAVLPEVEDLEITIQEKDLKIETYRASGAGGQHVNTTDSAVRITHIPTGTVVCQQDEKSQHQNKAKAFKILKSRIYESEKHKKNLERSNIRRSQIGSGDRSERIRTYNFPQGRVSDHRINLTLYKIDEIVKNGNLDEIIDCLATEDQIKKISSLDF
ncbi:peptide chain release factor 1 [Rickettsia endosymbiont of Cardiosporidium cionae]|uniref:peptide chain release factor 1 n=1 Tax=Rickettsia endosymbiont of Cardiosporidium cionae TaxID=2777155 RepID=UPI0018956019|nr:peptide chain release factor 1 [Rickettsia endosymbiont of Cardiosporidium cionae]KAF8818833.1 peptide chain release factor 1 [Rickettsia endosymbiont of Cardiosporidium cionae]